MSTPARTYWSAADLMAARFPEPRWAVPGLVPEGLSLLVGSPKVGKSWAALSLALAVAAGGRAFGTVPVDAGQVLILCLEDPPRRLQERLGLLLADDGPPAGLDLATSWPTLADGAAGQLDRWASDHADARLVVIDVLAKLRSPSKSDDRYQADYAVASEIKQVADAHGLAVVALHHTRKAAAEDFLDSVSGSHGLIGAADGLLHLHRQRGAADAVLSVTGRDVIEAEHPLEFDLTAGGWRLLDGPATDYSLGDTRRRILHLVRDRGPMTPKPIADALDADAALIRQTCKRMADVGQLDVTETGHYLDPSMPVTPVTAVTPPVTPVTGVTPLHRAES